MIDQECQNTCCNTENGHAGHGLLPAEEKDKVPKMKEPIMKQKEPSRLPLCCPRWLDGSIVDAETFCRELLEVQYSFPIEQSDDDALPPIDQHHVRNVPSLNNGEADCYKIG